MILSISFGILSCFFFYLGIGKIVYFAKCRAASLHQNVLLIKALSIQHIFQKLFVLHYEINKSPHSITVHGYRQTVT